MDLKLDSCSCTSGVLTLHQVHTACRPFMGPNLYLAPPGAYTHMHQDGHGTVDSGHIALGGYNEVVMLRRMPERCKRDACRILAATTGANETDFDALYDRPHADTNVSTIALMWNLIAYLTPYPEQATRVADI